MKSKITGADSANLKGQLIKIRTSLKDKRAGFFLKRAEHPLYQVMTTMLRTISIKNEEGVTDLKLIKECKEVRKKIQTHLNSSIEYIEYLIAVRDFREVKKLYVFSKNN